MIERGTNGGRGEPVRPDRRRRRAGPFQNPLPQLVQRRAAAVRQIEITQPVGVRPHDLPPIVGPPAVVAQVDRVQHPRRQADSPPGAHARLPPGGRRDGAGDDDLRFPGEAVQRLGEGRAIERQIVGQRPRRIVKRVQGEIAGVRPILARQGVEVRDHRRQYGLQRDERAIGLRGKRGSPGPQPAPQRLDLRRGDPLRPAAVDLGHIPGFDRFQQITCRRVVGVEMSRLPQAVQIEDVEVRRPRPRGAMTAGAMRPQDRAGFGGERSVFLGRLPGRPPGEGRQATAISSTVSGGRNINYCDEREGRGRFSSANAVDGGAKHEDVCKAPRT